METETKTNTDSADEGAGKETEIGRQTDRQRETETNADGSDDR